MDPTQFKSNNIFWLNTFKHISAFFQCNISWLRTVEDIFWLKMVKVSLLFLMVTWQYFKVVMVQPLVHFLLSLFQQHYLALLRFDSKRNRYLHQGFRFPFSFLVSVPFTLQCPSKTFIHFSRNVLPIPLSISCPSKITGLDVRINDSKVVRSNAPVQTCFLDLISTRFAILRTMDPQDWWVNNIDSLTCSSDFISIQVAPILLGLFFHYPFQFHPDGLPIPVYPFNLDQASHSPRAPRRREKSNFFRGDFFRSGNPDLATGKIGNYDLQVELCRSNKSIWKAINPNSLKLLLCFLFILVHSQLSDILTFWTLLSLLKVIGKLLTIVIMPCLFLSACHKCSKMFLFFKNPLILFHLGLIATISNPCSNIKVIRLWDFLAYIQQWGRSFDHSCNQDLSNCSVCSLLIKSFFIPNVNLKDDFIYLGGHKAPASSLNILGSPKSNPNPQFLTKIFFCRIFCRIFFSYAGIFHGYFTFQYGYKH